MKNEQRNKQALEAPTGGMAGHAASGAAYAFGGQGLRLAIQIGGVAILARLLAPSDFGLLAMAASITAFVNIFTEMGLSSATIRRQELKHEIVSSLFWLNMGVSAGLFVVAALFSPVVAWFFDDPRVGPLMILQALAIPASALGVQSRALMSRALRWRSLQIIQISSQALGFGSAILLAYYGELGYWAIGWQAFITAISGSLLSFLLWSWRPSIVFDWKAAWSDISYGLNLSGFEVLNYFHRHLDNILIGWRWGAEELGYYGRAYSLLTQPIMLVNNAVGSFAFPILSRVASDPDRWNRTFLSLIVPTSFLGVGICVGFLVLSEEIILLLLGEQWVPVIEIFEVLAIASAFATVSNPCGWIFKSLDRSKQLLHWSLFASPIFALSFVIGLPWKGHGVAIGYATTMVLLSPIYYEFAIRQTTLRRLDVFGALMPIGVIALIAVVAGLQSKQALGDTTVFTRFVVSSLVTGGVYGLLGLLSLFLLPQYSEIRGHLKGMLHLPFSRSKNQP